MRNIDLKSIASGDGGFVLTGAEPGDRAAGIAPAGDVNGDGIDDFVVGAAQHFNGGLGKAYVVFGGQPFDGQEQLAQTGASLRGFQILGESGWTGWSPRSAGDVNGDGFGDLVITSLYDEEGGPRTGSAYVVFGKTGLETVRLEDVAAGIGGFKMIGTLPGGYIGYGQTATGIGDVNHDGLDDVLVGATTDFFSPGQGEAYVVYGKASTGPVSLLDVKRGEGGFLIRPDTKTLGLGASSAPLGDVNADGIADFGFTAATVRSGPSQGFVIFGRSGPWSTVDLASVSEGIGGYRIDAENVGDISSNDSIEAAGDVNGDGVGDLIIGARENDAGGANAGAAYVIFGGSDISGVNLDDIAAGRGGFKIIGERSGNNAGMFSWSLGDINADGLADVVLGAINNNGGDGAAYVVYGKTDTAAVDLGDVAKGLGGFKLLGFDAIQAGAPVAALGDVTGDGAVDIGVGSYAYDGESGAAFVLSGAEFTARTIIGTAGDDILCGGAGDDVIDGLGGRDRIYGLAGDDDLRGGGNCDLVHGGKGDDLIDGGRGDDRLFGGGGADLVIDGQGADRLHGGADGDVFRFVLDGQCDRIRDFGPGDAIDLAAWDIDYDDLRIRDVGHDTVSISGGGDRLLVHGAGLQADDLQQDRFVLGGASEVLFADHFDGETLSSAWETRLPSQWIEDGWLHTKDKISGPPRDSHVVVHDRDAAWTDYTVSLKADFVATSSWRDFTLVLRSDGFLRSSEAGGGSGYQVIFNGAEFGADRGVQLWRSEGEYVWTDRLAKVARPLPDDPMDILLSVEGGRIRAWVDGDQVFDVTDPDPLPFGGFGIHGIWESESRFDDIVITEGGPDMLL